MLLIYTPSSTSRLLYTLDLIFKDILGVEYQLTHDAPAFKESSSPKLSYSNTAVGDELFFFASHLLFEKGIHAQEISVFEWEGTKAFFATHPENIFPFDPFAASFYLVSRYEEYLPHKKDTYGRFDAKESLAWKKGFLQKPLVNIWAKKIKEVIQKKYPGISFPEKKYQFISTIDIDNAYAYREKGIVRTAGALARSLIKFDGKDLKNRLAVLFGNKHDPYDTYDELSGIQQEYQLNCIYFFLLGDYADMDRNVSYRSKKLQSLINSIADKNECGIHPSFASNSNAAKINIEKNRLQNILQRDVTKSRQHFLMLRFPETYRNLIENGISDDYSMGYSGDVGFRASICTPFYFYDLDKEAKTALRIHSFAVMEATLKYYLKITPEESLARIEPLITEVKAVDGIFMSLWHNESLSNMDSWEGWQDIYEQMVKIAAT